MPLDPEMMLLFAQRLARMPWGNPNDCEQQQRTPHEQVEKLRSCPVMALRGPSC